MLWGLLCSPAVNALTITSAATGDWNAVATWAIVTASIPGTISTVNGSATVTGTGTQFLQLKAGDQLYTNASALIGTISSVASNTSLTLTAPATANRTNVTYRIRKVPDANDAANVGTTATHVVTIPAAYAAQVGALTIGATTQNDSAVTLAAANSSLNAGAVTINRTSSTPRTHSLNVNAGTATLASLAITGGTGSRAGQLAISTGTATVTGAITFAGTAGNARITFTNNGRLRVSGSLGTGGTLTPSTGTVEYDGAGAQTVQSGYSYYNLTLSTSGTKTPSAGTVTVAGALTLNSGVTYEGTTNNPAVNIAGDFSNSGTFNSGTGLFTFAGTNHALTGTNSNTTFTNLRINSTGTLTLSQDATVNGTLTFSDGRISTGANNVVLGSAGTITGASATSYVVGNFRKTYAAAANLSYVAEDFPVGDATNYTPVNITAGTTTTAGTLTVSTTATDHPQVTTPILSTGIDANLSVNRYWTFVSNGVATGTDIAATFHFIAGTPVDLDVGAQTFNFIVQRYDQTVWHQTTLNGASGDNTQVGGIAIGTGTHDFAIGQPLPGGAPAPVGRFNVFQSATPANDLEGKIFTKQAGVLVTDLDVIHTNASKNNLQGGSVTVDIELLDATNGGTTDGDGCSTNGEYYWPLVQTVADFTFTSRGTLPGFTVANTYRNLRFRVRYPAGGPYTQIGCSQDNFAVRPTSITISAHDATWQTAGTGRLLDNASATGGYVHAASTSGATTPRPFTLRATAQAQSPALATFYDGNPTTVSGFPACGTLCTTPGTLSFGAWSGAGTRDATAHYSEVGTVSVQLEDTTYASVDEFDGSTAAMRTIPATATVEIGRFVPDYFDVATSSAPTFATFCGTGANGFTYIGQPFGYATAPTALITAKNAAGVTTQNYQSTLWKFGDNTTTAALSKSCPTGSATCQFTTARTSGGAAVGRATESFTYLLSPASTPGWDDAGAAANTASFSSLGNGTGAVTFNTSGTIAFNRSTSPSGTPAAPQASFTADITNTVTVQDDSEAAVSGNGIIDTVSGAAFANIPFDQSKSFRYGRLRMQNALASSGAIALPVPIEAQYWNGTLFMLNSDDACTTLPAANVGLSDYRSNLGSGETLVTPTPDITFTAGRGDLKLSPPGPLNNGSVLVTPDLAAAPVRLYLQGAWTGATYTENPSARASFGLFGSQPRNFIFQRENY